MGETHEVRRKIDQKCCKRLTLHQCTIVNKSARVSPQYEPSQYGLVQHHFLVICNSYHANNSKLLKPLVSKCYFEDRIEIDRANPSLANGVAALLMAWDDDLHIADKAGFQLDLSLKIKEL